jgi:hypothetical protein
VDARIAEWLASNDTGSSSKAIVLWLSSKVTDSRWGPDAPRDPADLARCLRLLERIPEWKARIPEMAGAGGYWPTFIKHWDAIVASFMSECGGKIPAQYGVWPDFTRTYELMRKANDEARKTESTDFTEVRIEDGPLAGCSFSFGKDDAFGAAVAAKMKARK